MDSILILEDEKNIRTTLELFFQNAGYDVYTAADVPAALRCLNDFTIDLILADIRLGDITGVDFLGNLRVKEISAPVILMSGHASLSEVAQGLKLGAFDFIEKPFTLEKLKLVVDRGFEFARVRARLHQFESTNFRYELIGASGKIKKLKEDALRVSASSASVFITGESGTGKEMVAHIIHHNSARKMGPFIKVNCSAIPETLIEAELFGYEKGAFSGAQNSKRGFFEQAHTGTLLLDEIADLSLSAQAKILRALQEGEIQKLGSEKTIRTDVRVLSASHKDLITQCTKGLFREDLYYRLNVVTLKVPALREHPEDLPELVRFFIEKYAKLNNVPSKLVNEEMYAELQRYSWPGNIRELQNLVERWMIMGGSQIAMSEIPESLQFMKGTDSNDKISLSLRDFRDQAEKDYIVRVLEKNNGNVTKSAQELAIGRTYLHKRMVQLRITKDEAIYT